jgi:hypothetical protein
MGRARHPREALVILNSNPLGDISHGSDIESVKKNGVLYPAEQFPTGITVVLDTSQRVVARTGRTRLSQSMGTGE